jgi:transcriptional regulator with XRE-family HTH domain
MRLRDQLDQAEEMTLAMAQSWICIALRRSKVKKSELARRLGVSRPYVSNLLSGGENLTLRQLARVMWALGFEVRFDIVNRSRRRQDGGTRG